MHAHQLRDVRALTGDVELDALRARTNTDINAEALILEVSDVLDDEDWAPLRDGNEALPDAIHACAPVGCLECRRTGFLGRIGLYELLPLGSRLRGQIRADMDLAGFTRAARTEGLRTLRQAGLEKVAQGLTTIEEVLSVLPPPDEPSPVPDP